MHLAARLVCSGNVHLMLVAAGVRHPEHAHHGCHSSCVLFHRPCKLLHLSPGSTAYTRCPFSLSSPKDSSSGTIALRILTCQLSRSKI